VDSELLQGFYLGDVLIEPLQGRVTGKAGPKHIRPKAIEVLLCLAQSPGKLVTREALLARVWGTGKGSQETLSHSISEIRHALGDHPENPIYLQTLPRRGYRLVVSPEPRSVRNSSVVLGLNDRPTPADIGLFENLKRRGVIETGVAYLLSGWLLIQIADIVFEQLHLPQWTGTFVTVLVIAGFPIAIVLSWFLEFRDGQAFVHDVSAVAARRRRFSRTYLSVVGALGIAAIIVYIYDRNIGLPTSSEPVAIVPEGPHVELPPIVENSLAVLPFLNLDGSNETRIFADGLMDDLITQASRIPGLRIPSRGDSSTLAPNSPSQLVRDRLRVETYIEGSVEMSAERIRVIVQMIESETGHHVLSRKFDRPREDFFNIRDEITDLIIANIRVALPQKLRVSSLKMAEDPSLNAYVLYRRGIDTQRQPESIDTITSALGWFDAALNIDPEYAAAHAGRCNAYVSGYRVADDASFIDKAQSACAKALALNPNLDIVHTALGDLYRSTGQYLEAEAAYLRAIANDPSSFGALSGLGETYQALNRLDDAESSLRKAVDIHPGNVVAYHKFGTFLFRNGRYADAARQFEFVVALEPEDTLGFSNLASAYMLQGFFPMALATFQKAIDIAPIENAHGNLGMLHYYMGDLDAAIENHLEAVRLAPNDYFPRSNLGDALWAAGRKNDAQRAFEKADRLANEALLVNPNDPFTLMDLAWIKTSLGEDVEARRLINRALDLIPGDPYVHYINGLILNRHRDIEGAVAAFEIAVESGYPEALLADDPNISNLRQGGYLKDITSGSM
jgi:tetratricopeptide (TPR) repeat protein/DNA-binding winged helix-turn-helix (wHTH) protein